MPLKKILFRPGVNRENTRYASESLGSVSTGTQSVGGWYESDKVRFRAGTPEKIGGWNQISSATFLGICRSLWNWVTLGGLSLIGVGTNKKFYISSGGQYYDITPVETVHTLTDPFATDTATNSGGYTTVTVTDSTVTYAVGDYVVFNPTVTVGSVTIGGEYQIETLASPTSYTITAVGTAGSSTSG